MAPPALRRRAGVRRPALERLAAADAFRSMGLDRRAALWAVRGQTQQIFFGDDFLQFRCNKCRSIVQFCVQTLDVIVIPLVHRLDGEEFVGKRAARNDQ